MNLGGIKISSAELERVCATEGLKECAAIAVPPKGGGPARLVVVAVMEEGAQPDTDALANDAIAIAQSPQSPFQDSRPSLGRLLAKNRIQQSHATRFANPISR